MVGAAGQAVSTNYRQSPLQMFILVAKNGKDQPADREGERPASLRQAHIYGWRPAASQNWKNLVKMGGQCVVRQLSMI